MLNNISQFPKYIDGFDLKKLSNVNLIVGKSGTGKTTILKQIKEVVGGSPNRVNLHCSFKFSTAMDWMILNDDQKDYIKYKLKSFNVFFSNYKLKDLKELYWDNGMIIQFNNGETLSIDKLCRGELQLLNLLINITKPNIETILIDNIEDGFYDDIQHEIWKIIFESSKKFEKQFFITSFSSTVVNDFFAIWKHYPSLGSYYLLPLGTLDCYVNINRLSNMMRCTL